MQAFLYVEINVFALTVLFLIFLNLHHQAEKYLIEQKLFLALLGSNVLILILDTFMWMLDGKPGVLVKEVYFLVTALYYTLNPVICMIWSLYADYQVYRDESRFKKLLLPFLIPVCANTVLSFLSFTGNLMFYIDENNLYHRGRLFYLMAVLSYLYLVYTLLFVTINRKKIQKHHFIPFFAFAIPPFIGGILQSMFYGVSLIWICMTVSVLIIFINIQNDQLYTDHLTGLFNRRQLDCYLRDRMQSKTAKTPLAGIMIDLNSFKLINDIYGHAAGDQALEYTANILKTTFQKKDFISRYGGDEFVIIIETDNPMDLRNTINRLNANIEQFNLQKITPYTINLSLGYDFFDGKSDISAQKFLKHIDDLMYEDKKKQKY